MEKIYHTICILFLLMLFSTNATSQKCAHLNFTNLVSMMPESESAYRELSDYQEKLAWEGEKMAANLQKEVEAFFKVVQMGIDPKERQKKEVELQNKQQEVRDFEQKMVQRVQSKRLELLTPIIERAKKAIGEVAQKNGYDAVLDTSEFNTVLFATHSKDLMPLVKAKLGID